MNTIESCFLTCLLALSMRVSCFGVQMGPIPMEYPNKPSMVEYQIETAQDYPLEYPGDPSMEYPFGPGGQTGPDVNDNMMGSRVRRSPRKPSMVETPFEEPQTEYPWFLK